MFCAQKTAFHILISLSHAAVLIMHHSFIHRDQLPRIFLEKKMSR